MKNLEMYRKDNDKLKQKLEDLKKSFDQSTNNFIISRWRDWEWRTQEEKEEEEK